MLVNFTFHSFHISCSVSSVGEKSYIRKLLLSVMKISVVCPIHNPQKIVHCPQEIVSRTEKIIFAA